MIYIMNDENKADMLTKFLGGGKKEKGVLVWYCTVHFDGGKGEYGAHMFLWGSGVWYLLPITLLIFKNVAMYINLLF